MAIITMPDDLAVGRGCSLELVHSDILTASDPAGTIQARGYGVPTWALTLVSPDALTDRQAGKWKALGLTLRGAANILAAYDPSRPVPLGSVRGELYLAEAAAAGASQIRLVAGAGQVGRTLVMGDLLQVGTGQGTSQVVVCVADAVVDGSGLAYVQFEPPLRMAFAPNTAITWDHPRVYMLRVEPRFGWSALTRRITSSMRLSLVEKP